MNGKKSDRHIIVCILSTLLLTLLLTARFIRTAGASELVILYSNDIRGETEPCG